MPDENIPFHLVADPDYPYIYQAGTYFNEKGIIGDAHIHWLPYCSVTQGDFNVAPVDQVQLQGSLRSSFFWAGFSVKGQVRSAFLNRNRPQVGLIGYSYNRVSLSGLWFGFRRYILSCRSEWSPSSWD